MTKKQSENIISKLHKSFYRYDIEFIICEPLNNSTYSIRIRLIGNKYLSSSTPMNLTDLFYKRLKKKVYNMYNKEISFNNIRSVFWFKFD